MKTMLINTLAILLLLVVATVVSLAYGIHMPGKSLRDGMPPLPEALQPLRDRLSDHVWFLAEQLGERNHTRLEHLHQAAGYIERQFEDMGYVPEVQTFGRGPYQNIIVDLHGTVQRDEILVVGAHYDSAWMTPGADDNASGVAGLLEIARILDNQSFKRSMRLVAFANEEDPFFGGDEMGSRVNAVRSYDRHENIVGMLSLEMIGYFTDLPRSQYYPRVVRRFYPTTGNFIAFVSNLRSRSFLHDALASFRSQAQIGSEGLAAPQWLVPDIRRSDNSSFWYYGYPAVMVTDTSNFRNMNYHTVADTHRTLNYDAMALLVSSLTRMLITLAEM